MNPNEQQTGQEPAQPTTPPAAPTPTPSPNLGVSPAPTDQQAPAADPNVQQPMAAPVQKGANAPKNKLPFLIGVGLVVIVLIAAILMLAL